MTVQQAPVYFRTYEPIADAACSVFIAIPDEIEPVGGQYEITIESQGNEPFRLIQAVAHSESVLTLSDGAERMGIGFFTPKLCYTDFEADARRLTALRDEFGHKQMLRFVASFQILYMSKSDEELHRTLTYLLELGKQTGVEMYLNLNTWWDGTPLGPDGKGGYFSDVEYNQVVYNPKSGDYTLTVPNIWADVPWYTMNHETLNEARKKRARELVDFINYQMAQIYENHQDAPHVHLFIDNEPTYWANFAYSDSPDSGGDFCEAACQAARKAGVDLVPKGGLTEKQRLWMLKNLNDYIADLAHAMHESAVREYAVVEGGKTRFANRQLAENTYTHVFSEHFFPYFHFKYPQWETHVTKWAKLGIETVTWEDVRRLDYAIQFGKFNNVNAERACYCDRSQDFHHMFYLFGADASIIFNFIPWDVSEIETIDHQGHLVYSEPDYALPVYQYDVFFEELRHPGIISKENLALRPSRHRKVLQPEKPGTGSLTLCAGTAGQYPYGARLELRALVRPDNGGITLYVGSQPDKWTMVQELAPHSNPMQSIFVDIPTKEYAPEDRIYIRLEITSTTFEADWAQLNYVWFIRLLANYSKRAGHENGFAFTYDQKRALSTMVIYREERRRLCEAYPTLADGQVRASLQSERYRLACQQMLERLSGLETNRFIVKDYGDLGGYPLHCRVVGRPVTVEAAVSMGGYTVQISGEAGAAITFDGWNDAGGCTAKRFDVNRYLLTAGSQPVTLTVEESPCAYGGGFVGQFVGWDDTGVVVQCQNASVSGYQPYWTLPLAPSAVLLRTKDGDPAFLPAPREMFTSGDRLEIATENGRVTELRATYGLLRGTVEMVQEIEFVGRAHNAFLTVADDKGQTHTLEIGRSCALHYKTAPTGDVLCCGKEGLRLDKGQSVVVRYSPYCSAGRLPRALSITDEE